MCRQMLKTIVLDFVTVCSLLILIKAAWASLYMASFIIASVLSFSRTTTTAQLSTADDTAFCEDCLPSNGILQDPV
jgi:uncharacterized membrane protein